MTRVDKATSGLDTSDPLVAEALRSVRGPEATCDWYISTQIQFSIEGMNASYEGGLGRRPETKLSANIIIIDIYRCYCVLETSVERDKTVGQTYVLQC